MSYSGPVTIFLADTDETRRGALRTSIDDVRRPQDAVIETTLDELPTRLSTIAEAHNPALVFLSVQNAKDLEIACRAKKEGSPKRVFALALVDPEDDDLLTEAYSSGLNACIPLGAPDETASRVREAAQFALGVAKI